MKRDDDGTVPTTLGPLFGPPKTAQEASRQAALQIESQAPRMRAAVLEFLCGRCEVGATREEIEVCCEMRGSTVRPRVVELLALGLLTEGPDSRPTTSGRRAMVLRATK